MGNPFVKVDNHLAFYIAIEREHRVVIMRFLDTKRDWVELLRLGFAAE